MITVGITGGIASGKSMVARMFRHLGCYVIDTDTIARDTVVPKSVGWQRVVENFGQQILTTNNEIDRKKLGEIVFADHQCRQRLNEILHPLIIKKMQEQVKEIAAKDPAAIIIIEVPLLIECDLQKDFDKVIVVWADKEAQIRRLMQRDGLGKADAGKRIDAQISLDKKKEFADFVIENDKSKESAKFMVKDISLMLKKIQAEKFTTK